MVGGDAGMDQSYRSLLEGPLKLSWVFIIPATRVIKNYYIA